MSAKCPLPEYLSERRGGQFENCPPRLVQEHACAVLPVHLYVTFFCREKLGPVTSA